MSVWCRVAVSARAGKEPCVLQFRLVRTRSFGSCSFRLVRTRSIGVAFYARADQERWCCLLCSCRPGALVSPFMLVRTRSVVPCSLGSCRQGALCLAV
ncbi:hypothetical protein EV2_041745 [Malus domestica]